MPHVITLTCSTRRTCVRNQHQPVPSQTVLLTFWRVFGSCILLILEQGGTVVEFACVVELKALNGTQRVQREHSEVAAWSLISEEILTLAGPTDASA
jgi:hypothetical protein